MRQDFDLTNFTAGELSPRMQGRVDYAKYFDGADTLLNMIVMPQGGATRRPGSIYVAPNFNQSARARLRRFQFSNQQSYMLEFGAGSVRVFRNDGLILNVQAVTGAINNGAGLVRLVLASAAGLYTNNTMTVSGVVGTVEANGTYQIENVIVTKNVLGAADNGSGGIRLQVADTTHFVNGGLVTVASVGGTIEANGTWRILIYDATHIDLQASVFADAWTSGGTVTGTDAFAVDLIGVNFVHAYISGGSTSTPVQIPTPYAQADLFSLYFTQSDDTLFISHGSYPFASLARSSNTNWSYQAVVFRDGPYLDVNATKTTLTVSQGSYNGGHQTYKYGWGGYTYKTNPGSVTRSINVVASSTFGINTTPLSVGQGFLSSDVGRHLRIKLLSTWCWCLIEEYVTPVEVIATVQPTVNGGAWGDLDGAAWQPGTYYPVGVVVNNTASWQCVQAGVSATTGSGPVVPGAGATSNLVGDSTVIWAHITGSTPTSTTFWALGKWSVATYPIVCTFWQQRLMLLGTNLQPDAVEGSVTGDFTNYAPTQQDGTVVDTNALSWVISDDQVNSIQWVKAAGAAQAAQLAIGTVGEEHILQAASTAQPLTATNVQVYPETAIGTADIEPLRIGKSLIFVDRAGRKMLEWTFNWQVNGYNPVELTKASEHITVGGVVAMLYAQAPHRTIWALLANGSLMSATYNKDENIFAPSHHVMGGQYYGGAPIVESMDVIPSPDLSYDEIWLTVLRTINGVPFRSIEVLSRWFENSTVPQEDAVFVDCSLSTPLVPRTTTLNVYGLTNTQTEAGGAPQFTGADAFLVSGEDIFGGASVGQYVRVNGGLIQITVYLNATQVNGVVLQPLTSEAPSAAGVWYLSPVYTTASGLDYLDGETVAILGDGADFGTQAVVGGSVTLVAPGASRITAGLPMTSTIVTMPYEPQRAAAAASSGKIKRIDTMWVRVFESLGFSYGQRLTDEVTQQVFDELEALETRSASMFMGQAPGLFSGPLKLRPQGGYDAQSQMVFTTSSPMPLTVLSVFASADVGDLPTGGR
jgi:hypothetical protein